MAKQSKFSDTHLGACDTQKYPKHVMMITRGTQGDVQPFVGMT
jgi:hypothetical protein